MSSLFDDSQRSHNVAPQDDPKLLSAPVWAEARIFLAVAKSRSFAGAANSLNISRSTITNAVARLEDVVGAQLLVANPSGVALTDKGMMLADELLRVDQAFFSLTNALKAETAEAEGLVQVTCTEALTGLFIVPGLRDLNSSYPKLQLVLKNPINLLGFRENLSDIVVGFGPLGQPDLVSTSAGYLHLIPIASHAYIERFGLPTRKNLAEHHFIDAAYYGSQTPMYRSWRTAVDRGRMAHQIDNPFAYAMGVKDGAGIGLLGNFTLADRDVLPLDIGVHVKLPVFIHALEERLRARPVKAAYNFLLDVFSPSNSWFANELRLEAYPQAILQDSFDRITAGTSLEYAPAEK